MRCLNLDSLSKIEIQQKDAKQHPVTCIGLDCLSKNNQWKNTKQHPVRRLNLDSLSKSKIQQKDTKQH